MPFLHETIPDNVSVCPICKSDLNEPVPLQRSTLESMGDDRVARMLLPVGRSWWAIAAGYMGLFSLAIIPAPLALILGIIAIIHLRSRPDLHGMGRAVFGIVMGVLGTGGLIMAALFWFAPAH